MKHLMSFVKSPSRNHLVLTKGCKDALSYINVGLEVSTLIEDIIGDRRLSMRAQDAISKLLREHLYQCPDIGQYLALTNIGILFEPSLKIDLEGLFDRWSQNNLMVVDIGKGIVSSNRLFLTPNCPEQYSVSLERINYIIK